MEAAVKAAMAGGRYDGGQHPCRIDYEHLKSLIVPPYDGTAL